MPDAFDTPPALAPVTAQVSVWLNASPNLAVTWSPAIVAPVVEKAETEVADVRKAPPLFVHVPCPAVRVGQVTPVGIISVKVTVEP
jgi:hypothetical protein